MESTKVRIIATSDNRNKITKEEYGKNIPPCCSFKSIEEHEHIGLCWSLVYRLETGKSVVGMCDDCTENPVSPYAINSIGG